MSEIQIPCRMCGKLFTQKKIWWKPRRDCPDCFATRRMVRDNGKRGPKPSREEIILPVKKTATYDKRRGEWSIPVRVRRRGSDDPLQRDRIYLGIKGRDADKNEVQDAFDKAYVRLSLEGHCTATAQQRKKVRDKRRIRNKNAIKDWNLNIGVTCRLIKKRVYKVELPDPTSVDEKILVGEFDCKSDALSEQYAKSCELAENRYPCAVCGRIPTVTKFSINHIISDCPNHVRFPDSFPPLFQTKLWNMIYSKGKTPLGWATLEDLKKLGYVMFRKGMYLTIPEVEFDLNRAKDFAVKIKDEDAMFE